MTMGARRLAPIAALTAGLLAACGRGGQDTSSTSGPDPGSSTATVTETATSAAVDRPEQQELTRKQIRDALPKESEAPDGFVDGPRVDPASESTRETDPDTCRAVYLDSDEVRDWQKEHFTHSDGVRYSQPGDAAGRPSVSIYITTYDRPLPKKFFDKAGSMLGECSTFAERNDAESSWIDKKASNITAPVVGDQSYAHRVGLTDLDLTIDQLWVRSGHNLINIRVLTGYRNYSDETLSDLAEGVLEDLGG